MNSAKIKIGPQEQPLDEAEPQWIISAINGEREHGPVCVQFWVDLPGINVHLTTPTCGGGGRGGRKANPDEQELIDLWRHFGLFDDADFDAGKVVAFVKQAVRMIGASA